MKVIEVQDVGVPGARPVFINHDAIAWIEAADNGRTHLGLLDGRKVLVMGSVEDLLKQLGVGPEGAPQVF